MGIVAGDEYGVLRVVSKALTKPWNSASAQTEHGKADKAHAITSLCLADTEPTFIIAARANGSVTLHEPKTLNEVAVLAGASSGKAVHAGAVQSATDADVAVASENGCIRQYQVTKGLEGHLNPVGSYLETGKELTCCQFSTEGPLACVGSRVKEVTVWNLQSGVLSPFIHRHDTECLCTIVQIFSPPSHQPSMCREPGACTEAHKRRPTDTVE